MSWYYPETRPRRLPLTTPVRPATSGGTGGPPTGPAGGDLGAPGSTYPDPTIAPGVITTAKLADAPNGVATAKLNDGAVTDAKITTVAYGKVTGAPTSLPPSGAVPAGDLSGSYPSPTIGAGKVTNAALAASGLDASKLTTGTLPVAQVPNLDAAKITTGTFPLARIPTMDVAHLPDAPAGITTSKINDAQVTDAKVNDVAATKLTGTIAQARFPTAPSGLLTANINDAQVTDAKLAPTAVTAGTYGTAAKVARITVNAQGRVSAVSELDIAPTGGSPSGPASGSLAGSYPGPSLTTTGVTAGTYGTQYKVAQVTVTAEGRITAVVEVTVRARWG